MKLTPIERRYIVWILPALLTGVFLLSGCGNARTPGVMAQPLTLATPASSPANAVGSITLPEQIVVIVVTPTSEQGATSQQNQGQQNQGQSNQGMQQASQGDEGQAVAQAQTTPQSQTEGEQSGGEQAAGQAGDQELISMGEPIYTANCAACHQPNGAGIANYPALAGSQLLTEEDPTSAIDIVVNGRGQMPAFGNSLSTEEIAAVLSYERNSWGNSAGVITADQVSQFQQGGEVQAGGEGSQAQSAPPAEAQGEQSTGTGEAQATPVPEAQGEQSGGSGEAQASPAPETGSTEQAAGVAESQAAPVSAGTQVSVTQEQAGNVITIRIEIVIMTPEAGAASATQQSQPASGDTQVAPVPSGGSVGEAEATPVQAQSTEEAPPQEETEATPAPQGESSGGVPSGETAMAAGATPSPAAQGEQSGGDGEAQAQPTPASQGESSGGSSESGSGEAQASSASEADSAEQAQSGDQELLAMGEYLYGTNCANCHQLSGEGNTAYPSLVNNEFVIAEDPTAALLTILNGRGHMPAFAGLLSDQEIAAILSHERNAWGNSASVVTVEQVAQLRGDGAPQGENSGGEESSQGQAEAPPPAEPSAIALAPEGGAALDVAAGASDAPLANVQEAATIHYTQAMLSIGQFLQIPEVAAIISSVRTIWYNSAPGMTNAQVQ